MVARLTPDQKVACLIHVGFIQCSEFIAASFTSQAEFVLEPLIVMLVI